MKVLVVYAHPNPKSFGHAVLEKFTKGLKDGGHSCEIVDLYDIGFDPCFKSEDFAQFTGGEMPKDVLEQQEKAANAGALVFIYPVWWWGYPAILKGWIDRVFSDGFAYKSTETGGLEGLLKSKKVLLTSTTMGEEEHYKGSGIEDAMKGIDRAIFTDICGIQNVEHVFLYAVHLDDEVRKRYLESAYRLGKEF
ncbi:MAG: NAD(P)H-dependent oxidoreductase [Candidatus Hydromicrobium sp.]|nr:NAD(P)H-dependent oxidoreductase [Candidatus Hydromicrobium sp.]